MPRSAAEQLFTLDTALDLAIDQLGDQFEGVARAQARRWFRATAAFVGTLPTKGEGLSVRGVGKAAGIDRALATASEEGLRTIGTSLDAFTEISRQATRALKVAGIDPKLTASAVDALVAYRQLKLLEFQDLQATYTTRIGTAVRRAALSGQSAGELLVEAAEIAQEWIPRARTIYETAIAEFAQVVSHAKSTSGSPQARVYLYTGPIDNRLRPFCKGVVGKVFARAAIDRMDNKQLPNTFLTRGGYNCRHQWRDVTALTELARLAGTGRYANDVIAAKVATELRKPRSGRKAS